MLVSLVRGWGELPVKPNEQRVPTDLPTARFANAEAAQRAGERVGFSFGENWAKYIKTVDPYRIEHAAQSLQDSFAGLSLTNERFIDVGCGSGLFSLCAALKGAHPVISIDVDPNSVRGTRALKRMYLAEHAWRVLRGSVLSRRFVDSIEPGTRVFSWGVLHHTGAMWNAVENTLSMVAPGGVCCLALYTRPKHPLLMLNLKRIYNGLPRVMRPAMRLGYGSAVLARICVRRGNPFTYVRGYSKRNRGMSFWRDQEDWLGGLPYEYASTEQVSAFVSERGFRLIRVMARAAGANNEYLLERLA